MRRLFSTFARGWPGVGLLLMRVVAGSALIVDAVNTIRGGLSIEATMLQVLAAGAGMLLVGGLWTPLAGALVTTLELCAAFVHPGTPLTYILLATLSAALTLLGPGAWSVDARLFGWKRIDIPDRDDSSRSP